MLLIDDPQELQEQCLAWRKAGVSIALVPTMGFFHTGHERLMQKARQLGQKVIVSLFVNPSQFGPNEDLSNYPRDVEKDKTVAEGNQVDILFTPDVDSIYKPGYDTWVEVPGLSSVLCGASRPGHFRGVCTVVLKLFNIMLPNIAVFGQKDWQQLAVIRHMVKDLNLPVQIEGVPIAREADGLAMSSRNVYLTPDERAQAQYIYKALALAKQLVAGGEKKPEVLMDRIVNYWKENIPHGRIDYLQFVNPDTLQPLETIGDKSLAIVAMYLGKARLLDNMLLLE